MGRPFSVFGMGVFFGKYELLERIGSGGMAEVYRARLPSLHGLERIVAIKRILPYHCEDSSFINMFLDEAKITLALHHPSIGQVYELNQVDGQYYIALEFIDGPNLSTIIKRLQKSNRRLPLDFTIYVMMKVCEGLFAAHTQRDADGRELAIIHRDVSPHNVMVSRRGDVKLIDFGIAKARDRLVQTVAGTVRGKLLYMSPEQAASQELDPRSDVFSAGMMLLTFLNGRHIWRGLDEVEVLVAIRRWAPPSVRELRPDLDATTVQELQAIIDRAMAYNADERFRDAETFRVELAKLMARINPGFSAVPLGQFVCEVADGKADVGEPAWATPTSSADQTPNGHSDSLPGGGFGGAISQPGFSSGGAQPRLSGRPTATGLRDNADRPDIITQNTPLPDPHTPSHSRHLTPDRGNSGQRRTTPPPNPQTAPPSDSTDPALALAGRPNAVSPVLLVVAAVAVVVVVGLAVAILSILMSTPETGSLKITSDPPRATIRLDDQPLPSRTPALVEQVTPGKHTVLLTYEGESFETRVIVAPGEEVAVHGILRSPNDAPPDGAATPAPEPDAGPDADAPDEVVVKTVTLRIVTNVRNAAVYVNTERIDVRTSGKDDPLEISLETGRSYAIELRRSGWEGGTFTVNPDDLEPCQDFTGEGICKQVELKLRQVEPALPRSVDLQINSIPYECDILINGKKVCSNQCRKSLSPGTYTITWSNPAKGFSTTKTVEVKAGKNNPVGNYCEKR